MNIYEHDKETLQYIDHYSVTELVDRGQYEKTKFNNIKDAVKFRDAVLNNNSLARIAIYAVCTPPARPVVNLIMEV